MTGIWRVVLPGDERCEHLRYFRRRGEALRWAVSCGEEAVVEYERGYLVPSQWRQIAIPAHYRAPKEEVGDALRDRDG